jgi:hypothetical protein
MQPPQAGRSVAVGVFEREAQARQAAQALGGIGSSSQNAHVVAAHQTSVDELRSMLVDRGVPEGEARFYALENESGRTLVVVDASHDYGAARDALLRYGARDVQSQGAELVRGDGEDTPRGGQAVPQPVDVTARWEDVVSRYEMLWQQHYGTSDATWEQMEPIYRWAWQAANDPRRRGRPWTEVEAEVRRDWESQSGTAAWADVEGPIHDVWEDVADEASQGAEGGRDRLIPSRD